MLRHCVILGPFDHYSEKFFSNRRQIHSSQQIRHADESSSRRKQTDKFESEPCCRCVVHKNKNNFCLRDNLHDHLGRETLRALQGECMAQRKLSEAEMDCQHKKDRADSVGSKASARRTFVASLWSMSILGIARKYGLCEEFPSSACRSLFESVLSVAGLIQAFVRRSLALLMSFTS